MDSILGLIGRDKDLFTEDIGEYEDRIAQEVNKSRFLVIGGAGTIGSAICRELFKRNPRVLHVVDISENNMVELVRDVRSTVGYIDGEFATFAIDCGTAIFDSFMQEQMDRIGGYDYIFNTSALKHVRSEKDPYTLMRMVDTNIFNTESTLEWARKMQVKKYFCVSTDKAANPVNMMGASKRIMEMYLMRKSEQVNVSTARFANVAFSDGSLLYGFGRRIEKKQPLSAPRDVKRYFVTPKEAGELCIMSCLLGENRDIFFPKLDAGLDLLTFSDIAVKYLDRMGLEADECATEEEARKRAAAIGTDKKYPVYFFDSDTTGEKDYEEFYTGDEELDMTTYVNLGVIKNEPVYDEEKLEMFTGEIACMKARGKWTREELVELFKKMIPDFGHKETGKFLDGRM